MAVSKGCWTCKDRKVSCDRQSPVCSKCVKSKRICGGYGVRLSWPNLSDSRRALRDRDSFEVHHVASKPSSHDHWVNVTISDVKLHMVATNTDNHSWGRVTREQLAISDFDERINRSHEGILLHELWLPEYFRDVVSETLPVFGTDRGMLRDVLLRMALSDHGTRSANAVLLSILTLACYHRGTDIHYARRLKDTAIRALISAVDPAMSSQSAIEHVAAGLILCTVETQHLAGNTSDWVGFLCGAKQLLQAVRGRLKGNCPSHLPGSDAAVILGWLSYFDVLARFPFRHWRTEAIKATAIALGFDTRSPECAAQFLVANKFFSKPVKVDPAFSHPLLKLLGQVMHTRMYSSDPMYHSVEYQEHIKELRSHLEDEFLIGPTQDFSEDARGAIELTRVAALIYLERTTTNFSGTSERLNSWKRTGLSILARLESAPPSFSLFIVGCEAHQDSERHFVLDFFASMDQKPYRFNLEGTRSLIQTAWNQHDLGMEGQLDYIHKLNLVLSSRDISPSFF